MVLIFWVRAALYIVNASGGEKIIPFQSISTSNSKRYHPKANTYRAIPRRNEQTEPVILRGPTTRTKTKSNKSRHTVVSYRVRASTLFFSAPHQSSLTLLLASLVAAQTSLPVRRPAQPALISPSVLSLFLLFSSFSAYCLSRLALTRLFCYCCCLRCCCYCCCCYGVCYTTSIRVRSCRRSAIGCCCYGRR